MSEPSPVRRILVALIALLVAPLASLHAADAAKPSAGITQQLLNSIHVTPKLIFDPFPAYEQKFLPFAMAASMEATSKGRLWTCWAGGQDGPNAYLLASFSEDQGKSWRDPVFVIDPQGHGLKMGTRLGSFWCDPKGRLWLFFHQSCGMFDGSHGSHRSGSPWNSLPDRNDAHGSWPRHDRAVRINAAAVDPGPRGFEMHP